VRWAFLSDIHSNLDALGATLEHLDGQGADAAYALGDLVGYNAQPNEVLQTLQARGITCILGNHDWAATKGEPEGFNPYALAGIAYTRKALRPELYAWLAALPQVRDIADGPFRARLVHGSPRDPMSEYVFPASPGWLFEELAEAAGNPDLVAMGHTHVPMRADHGTTFVNPGSVGQPRDGDPRAAWLELDLVAWNVVYRRVEYDIDGAAAAIRAARLPDSLAERLAYGQ
jgi:diadenosine tetraphosphatase ApaH/serine/threonine PP2A family protein phosphatase